MPVRQYKSIRRSEVFSSITVVWSALAVAVFLLVASSFPLASRIWESLFPKPTSDAASSNIWYPRQAMPAFVEPGKTFVAEVLTSSSLSTSGWAVRLENDLRSWNGEVVSAVYGKDILNMNNLVNSTKNKAWEITIRVPSDISPELFKLTISHSSGFNSFADQSVSVVKNLSDPFYILNLTDEQAWRWTNAVDGNKSFDLIRQATPVVNLINPRFVVSTGDLVEDPWYRSRHQRIESGGADKSSFDAAGCTNTDNLNLFDSYNCTKKGYTVPIVLLPGNHDVPKEDWAPPSTDALRTWANGYEWHKDIAQEYEKAFAQRAFSFQMGGIQFFGHDYFEWRFVCKVETTPCPAGQEGWILKNYRDSFSNASVNYRVVLQHYDDSWMSFNPDEDDRDYGSHKLDLMLLGHQHSTDKRTRSNYPVLVTTAALWRAQAGFIEFIKDSAGKWSSPSTDRWEDGGENDESEILPLVDNCADANNCTFPLNVEASFSQPNDGNRTGNSVTIRNDLQKSFPDGRIRFLLANAANYTVSGGEELAEYTYGNNKKAVLVKVNIKQSGQGNTVISVNGTGTAPTNTPTPQQPTPTSGVTLAPTATNTPTPTIPSGSGVTYYVAPNGSDTNNGRSLTTPFKTLTKAGDIVQPGDTVFVRGGTYTEKARINKGGTSANRVIFRRYQNEEPIFDGSGLSLTEDDQLFAINSSADYVTLDGFTFRDSSGKCFANYGDFNIIQNNKATECKGYGMGGWKTNGAEFRNNEVWETVTVNRPHNGNVVWASALTIWESTNTKLINNRVHNNHGEGINSWRGSSGTQIIGNTVFDNYGVNIYLDGATNAVVENNIVYETETAYVPCGATGSVANCSTGRTLATGIAISQEAYSAPYNCASGGNRLKNMQVRNNMLINVKVGLSFFNYESCSGWENFVIENNTIVNTWEAGMRVYSGAHIGNIIRNNIFTARNHSAAESLLINVETPGNTRVQNNAFYYQGAASTGRFKWNGTTQSFESFNTLSNVSNNLWTDPRLANIGAFSAEGYKLMNGSSLVDRGVTGPTTDYFGTIRPVDGDNNGSSITDIGAHELSVGAAPTPTPSGSSQTPYKGTPHIVPGKIEIEDFDNGGEGIAYHDTTTGNASGTAHYRVSDVDLQPSSDTGGGFNVGWTEQGEWLEYTIAVSQSGTYTISTRVASPENGGVFHIEIDGANITGPIALNSTGGWQNWTTLSTPGVSLTAGTHILRLVIDQVNSTNAIGNINWINLEFEGSSTLDADINNDGIVNVFDLGILSARYGQTILGSSDEITRASDINKDGVINVFDLGILIGAYSR